MKLTIAEATTFISKHLGVDVEITDESTCDWIVNTQTREGHPSFLLHCDKIEIIYSDGTADIGTASEWFNCWDTTDNIHIAKYRLVGAN
jgi:hypothetical protein